MKTQRTQTVSTTPAGRKMVADAKREEERRNPLIRAVEIEEQKLANYDEIMVAAVGKEALSDCDFFDQLHLGMTDLIFEASIEVAGLPWQARARTARLDSIWKAFVRKWAAKARQHVKLKASA